MKMFPIQNQRGAAPHPLRIPWEIVELAYSVYSSRYGRGQSLERLAERGGFGPGEMDEFNPGWRDQCSRMTKLSDALVETLAAAESLAEYVQRQGGVMFVGNTMTELREKVQSLLSESNPVKA